MKVELPPRILFTKEAYFRMMEYCRQAEGEITGFGAVTEHDSTLLIDEVYIIPQTATKAGVNVDGKVLLDFMKWCKDNNREDLILRSRLWWHSHADFGVFRSGTDNDTIRMFLGSQPYVLAVVGNHRGEYECSLHYSKPRASFNKLRIEVNDFDKKTVMAEIAEDIKRHVKMWRPEPPKIAPYVPTPSPTRRMESFESFEDYENSKFPKSVAVTPTGSKGIYEMTEDEWNAFLEKNGGIS